MNAKISHDFNNMLNEKYVLSNLRVRIMRHNYCQNIKCSELTRRGFRKYHY